MTLRTYSKASDDEKNLVLERFLNAHEEQLFPQEVVALYLQCSPWTLAKMRCEDQSLPFSKIGQRIAYKKKDVMAYLESKTVTNTAQY
ncbi:DNA-binding protein [Acinetobacter sp. ANC 5054]|uniref:helix-turn-helix domain-containing protein n=1 Tax=Acinetobacter sp. ANC 5054 TaxID=1977877 RepID=UPI000A33F723|nr:helix-turn-helix domain-containing protein [Acinetobacter sp. ANC 5054]OTG83286.1 DNA-binding protein [Acinetobacter sp. ANC 5054]